MGNAETYIACALAGLGLIQVPAYDVHEHLASGALVQVLGDCAQPGMAVHLVVSHRRHLSARVQAFGSWLAGVLEPHFRVAAAP